MSLHFEDVDEVCLMVASTMNLTEDKRFTLCLQLFFSQTIDMKVLASAGNIRDL